MVMVESYHGECAKYAVYSEDILGGMPLMYVYEIAFSCFFMFFLIAAQSLRVRKFRLKAAYVQCSSIS